MNNANFAHLHVHNEHSLLDGYGTAKQYAQKAADMGFKYLALTNHGNVDGCLKFQQACDDVDIKSILGTEFYIVPDATRRKKESKGHIVVLVHNQTGWQQLCQLITKSYLEGFYGRPRIDYQSFLDCDMSGWIVMTACVGSFLNQPGGEDFALEINSRIPGQLYYEIMPHDHEIQIKYHTYCEWDLNITRQLPLVATADCHYIEPGDVEVQDVLLAIQNNRTWKDPKRWSFSFRELYMRSADQMVDEFEKQNIFGRQDIVKSMANTVKIAKQCSKFRLKPQPVSLPQPPNWRKTDFFDLIEQGLEEKELIRHKEYQSRAAEEIRVIEKKGFENYYLIVKDVVEWAKANDIMVGPGRGSVGGSLVAYLMGITQIDSIKHKLSFSRFISEDRIDLPDIDLDFEKRKRHLVIEYLQNTYGFNHTAGVSTYGTLQSRGAIRDVGRIFEIPNKTVDTIAKSIRFGESNGLQTVLKNPAGKLFQKAYPRETHLATRLDGQIRNSGQHPAAIVLSDQDLRRGDKCTLRRSKNDYHLINWDMKDCEHFGLVKLDILGLSTLSVLNYARHLIGDDFDFDVIEFEDPKVFHMISEGHTAGMFQLSARPTTELCKDLKVETFEDIVAAIALVRPGPTDSGMATNFIERKVYGAKWDSMHPIYDEITADTYGLLVYQEQVMQVISRVGGLSESTADQIRKVIGKKRDPKEFEPYRKLFVDGCKKEKTLSAAEADQFWQGLLKWASYGFNRSHSVEYAFIAYWTAWLKIYYPAQFYCAHLTFGEFDPDKPDKSKQRVIDEIVSLGYRIMPPKVDKSDPCCWVVENKTLYMPFTELKSIGETSAQRCCNLEKTKCVGFWEIEITTNSDRNEELLAEIEAYDPESIPEGINEHLEFKINPDEVEYLCSNCNRYFKGMSHFNRPGNQGRCKPQLVPF